jgi:hypothetical protein
MTTRKISPRSLKTIQNLAIAISLLLIFNSISRESHAQTNPPYPKATLIAGLKQSAKDKKLSQQDFVQLIQQRGVDFQMTARDEAELRIAGASNEVIAAIGQNYRYVPKPLPKGTGSLTISSTLADCKVLVNGQARGTTDGNGLLRLPPLKAGQYKIVLRKENYEEQERVVVVPAGVELREQFALTGVKGRLTVNPNIPAAEVKLNGVAYPAGVGDLSLPAGSYEVRVSKPGFRTFTKNIIVTPRGSVTVDALLEQVPVEQLVAQAGSLIQASRYAEAIATSRELLAAYPDNAQGSKLLGLAYFLSARYSESVPFLTRAMSLGEQVVLPIQHHHRGVFNNELCSGSLTIGRGMLGFVSQDKQGHDFNVPASKIYELAAEPQKDGRVHVQVGIQKGPKEDKKTYNFHVSHAGTKHLDSNNPSSIMVLFCNSCEDETQAVYQVLRQLKDGSTSVVRPSLTTEGLAGPPALKRQTSAEVAANTTTVGLPSAVFRPYNNPGRYKLGVPANWKEVVSAERNAVFAPDGATTVVNSRTNYTHGVQLGVVPTQGLALPQAFERLIAVVLKSEPYLKQSFATQQGDIKGRPALSAPLKGKSPVTQRDEFALVYAVLMKNGDLFYVIAVSPQDEVGAYSATFGKIITSIEFLD